MKRLSDVGLAIMLQASTARFVEETPADESPAEWVERCKAYQGRLATNLGIVVRQEELTDLVTTFEELQSVEEGTHHDLTPSNRPELTDFLLGRAGREIDTILTHATHTEKIAA